MPEARGKEGRAMLFIRPTSLPTDEPLIDELTMRMTSALRQVRVPDERFCGVHVCICGAVSDSANRALTNGAVTNTLCVHYLAYHRAEVLAAELDAVWHLPASVAVPSLAELGAPKYRLRRAPVKSIICRVDGQIREEVEEEKEIVRALTRCSVFSAGDRRGRIDPGAGRGAATATCPGLPRRWVPRRTVAADRRVALGRLSQGDHVGVCWDIFRRETTRPRPCRGLATDTVQVEPGHMTAAPEESRRARRG